MLGPYKTNGKRIDYRGNKIFKPIKNVLNQKYSVKELQNRVSDFVKNGYWKNISRINHRITISVNEYFSSRGALFTLLPLTTRMISSPGAVYGKERIDYTTDTCPITVQWFNHKNHVFLSESSQIYLELALLQQDIDQVYSLYNSFRKEKGDATHLSEFHHVEYEGKVDQGENTKIAFNMIKKIVADLLKYNLADLKVFLTDDRIKELRKLARQRKLKIIIFKEAIDTLYKDTGDKKYKEFTLRHFGSWEETRLTEIYGGIIGIKQFPLLEVPFYHAKVDGAYYSVADNLDIIWPGYREILGSGHRVRNIKELEDKSKIFNLPRKDYQPYLQSRKFKKYIPTSGFGLGWERLLHGLLEVPFIWSISQFPRVDGTIRP